MIGAFQAAAPLSTLLGLVLGGIFVATWGWRAAFGLVAVAFRARSGVAALAGGPLQLMVVSTLYTWLPSYLNRTYGLAVDRAAVLTTAVILAGAIGTIVFAYLADFTASRDPRGRLRVPVALSVVTLALLTSAFALIKVGP